MDVWTLGEKWKKAKVEIDELWSRIDHMEIYLSQLTEVKDEAVPVKKTNKSGVRARRRTAKKS